MKQEDYRKQDATELARLVRNGDVKPRELVDAALEAVEAINPSINAVLETFDDEMTRASPSGPLHGVPFLLKDLVLHRRGGLLEMGSRMARGLVASGDTELMTRFRRAGLIAIGRTTTPELGHGCTTESALSGPTRNPWDRSRMAGGSSGGSAAAVAAGITPLAHANDGAGSIRIPAACCGLFGLKPSRGRVSLGPDSGEALFGMGIENVVSRTVRDSAIILDCIQGPAPGDPYIIERPTAAYAEEVTRDPGKLRVAYTTVAWSGAPIDPECVRATENAAKLCADLGHSVHNASPAFDYALFRQTCIRAWAAGIATWVDALAVATRREPTLDFLETATLSAYELGRRLSAAQLLEVPAALNQICRSVAPFFEDHDVLLTPTTSRPAQPLGTYNQNAPGLTTEDWFDRKGSFAPFLALFNVTGQPAMSVPLAVSSTRLPIGLHFVGRFGAESVLFRLAAQLERARPWAARRPNI
ncbi:MAG TPA: amidase [Steroidobacteraceae bacterium]|nr:amidase [Steroidobacteraceae bacterium]